MDEGRFLFQHQASISGPESMPCRSCVRRHSSPSPHPDPGGEPPRMEAKLFNSVDEAKGEVVRTVARMCAAAAVTAPKSGGQLFLRGKPLFIETVFVDDRETLLRLAGWMRQRGKERRQAIWLRDAALAERLDGVLFIGLKDWYPPIYDCGACGYATCAEFIEATRQRRDDSESFEFKGPHCNLRDIDLGDRGRFGRQGGKPL